MNLSFFFRAQRKRMSCATAHERKRGLGEASYMLYTSLMLVVFLIVMTAWNLFGSASMPLLVRMNHMIFPSNSKEVLGGIQAHVYHIINRLLCAIQFGRRIQFLWVADVKSQFCLDIWNFYPSNCILFFLECNFGFSNKSVESFSQRCIKLSTVHNFMHGTIFQINRLNCFFNPLEKYYHRKICW